METATSPHANHPDPRPEPETTRPPALGARETTAPERSLCFLGRQPILDSHGKVAAHDLLFRDERDSTEARFQDPVRATVHVLVAAFADLGLDTLLGSLPGFVNADPDLEIAMHAEALPDCALVFDLPRDVELGEQTIERVERLRRAGFKICLDDFEYRDPRTGLLAYADYAKVDFSRHDAITLRKITRELAEHSVLRIAARVETSRATRLVARQEWDFAQGYYFARPEIVERSSPSVRRSRLLELIGELDEDTPVEEIAKRLKGVPHLTMNLLSMANLMRVAAGQRIESVQQALVMVGRKRLVRWLHLLLFASDDQKGCADPLCQLASSRSAVMESLATRLDGEADPDRAGLAGLLSLTPALLGLSPKEVVRKLSLDYSIETALMRNEGPLGRLLLLVERREASDFEGVSELLDELGLDWHDLERAELDAVTWTDELSNVDTQTGPARRQ